MTFLPNHFLNVIMSDKAKLVQWHQAHTSAATISRIVSSIEPNLATKTNTLTAAISTRDATHVYTVGFIT